MRRFLAPLALASLAFVTALPARAEPVFSGLYDVRVLGLPVGQMQIARNDSGSSYSAQARFATTGVVGVLARVGFEMESRGRVGGDIAPPALDPSHYAERVDTGERAGPGAADFASGDPRLDPLAAMLIALASRPLDAGCAIDREIFDGTRTHRLTLTETARNDRRVTCKGEFRRVSGYTEAELKRRTGYRLELTYQVDGDQLRPEELKASSSFGPVTLVPREVSEILTATPGQ